jgi:mannose-6-phosphate isomerase-like protein (cupin superfamily)
MNIQEYISSGILELYVMGSLSDVEMQKVKERIELHPELETEVKQIELLLESYTVVHAIAPDPESKKRILEGILRAIVDPTTKAMELATVDYEQRLKNGEKAGVPSILNEKSSVSDYSEWLSRKDIAAPENFEDVFVKIIGVSGKAITAVVWIKEGIPYEVHEREYEKFMIVEGTCDIIISGKALSLAPGDFLNIPLYIGHEAKVTSKTPCKIILQRVAA